MSGMRASIDWIRHPAILRSAQILIGLVFIAASLAKIGNPRSFALNIHHYDLIPVALENLLAMTLPWIELVAGLALIAGVRARAAALLALLLMIVFTFAVLAAVGRGIDIECGCFGTSDGSRVGVEKLLQNLGLTGLAVVAGLRRR